MAGGVLQLGGDRQLRGIIRGGIQFRDDRGITQSNRAAGGEVDLAPQSHIFVGRRGIPVDKGDRQIVLSGGEDLYGENVFSTRLQRFGDVEFVGAPGAGDVVGV